MSIIQTQVTETINVANAIKEMGIVVKEVADNVVVAASASDEATEQQSAVVEEINGNVVNVQDMAEQTSQGAKQAAETGTDLSKLAANLREMITQFKT
ncbi:MAG: methyl-accepting chemotaxis protein [Gammaproteobacteria bacterium]|nr:methyl-accepting chemotaxis protein [Gammaproteobacteria bacterium]